MKARQTHCPRRVEDPQRSRSTTAIEGYVDRGVVAQLEEVVPAQVANLVVVHSRQSSFWLSVAFQLTDDDYILQPVASESIDDFNEFRVDGIDLARVQVLICR